MKYIFICLFFLSTQLPASQISNEPFSVSIALHRDDAMDAVHKKFFNHNPKVLLLYWKKGTRSMQIYSKHNKIETFDLTNPDDIKRAEKMYGFIPSRAVGSFSK